MQKSQPHHSRVARLVLNAVITACALLSVPAMASSLAAWSAHDKEVAGACVKASGLKDAQPVGPFMAYDDGIGKTALVVVGRYPQPHMNNRGGKVLCLFDRRTHQAAVVEADQLNVRTPPRALSEK